MGIYFPRVTESSEVCVLRVGSADEQWWGTRLFSLLAVTSVNQQHIHQGEKGGAMAPCILSSHENIWKQDNSTQRQSLFCNQGWKYFLEAICPQHTLPFHLFLTWIVSQLTQFSQSLTKEDSIMNHLHDLSNSWGWREGLSDLSTLLLSSK